MDTFRIGLENRASSRLRRPTPANVFSRGKRKRPVISAPIGPVKNSRGPDFTRSDTLIIVPAIKDCSEESLSDKENSEAKRTTRRISASFSTHGSLTSPPTVAKSGLTATTSCQSLTTAIPRNPLSPGSSLKNASKTGLTKSSSYGVYPSLDTIIQDENVPPPDHKESAPPASSSKPKGSSRLPKSRTLHVLNEIKTSISRSSLNSKPFSSRPLDDQSRKTSASSSNSLFTSSTSRLRLPRASLTSLSRSSSSSTTVTEVQSDPNQITTSQPSAYWSGRFVALHDRFLSEDFRNEEQDSSSPPPGQMLQTHAMTTDRLAVNARPTHLSYSTTTSALTSLTGTKPRSPSSTKDARCMRIFEHLDSLCATSEARRSLLSWQQMYARRMGKPQLLPQGGRMENKSLMGMIFGGGPRTTARRSLPAINEPSGVSVVKKKPNPAVRGRGKRLTIN
ncbi:hypothetical protein F66182_3710 [Fusarium sp. NRRL 66182]|nr:hypothetical protein F66182_3710 [Fusarium sp. NRRL 66182]